MQLGRHVDRVAAPAATAPPWPNVAWPVAAGAGVAAGILLGFGSWWGLALLTVPLLGWLGAGRARGRGGWLLALAALGLPLGYLREQAWWNAPDRMAPWVGAHLTLSGHWDGQFLHLAEPDARVALSPKPAILPGPVELSGVLGRPDGRRIPGGFDYDFWLRVQGVRTVLFGAQVRSSRPEGGLRGWFRHGLTAGLNEPQAALLQAVELGDKNDIGRQDFAEGYAARDAFARAGLAHLMALSGQNVALLVATLTFLLARTPLGLRRYGVIIAFLLGYLWLVGPSPSFVRAVLMGGAVLIGLWVGRGRLDTYGVLGLAAFASLLWQPGWLFDVGFQLSFLAVTGLTLTPRLVPLLPKRWPEWLRYALAGTLLAEAATLPLSAHSFGMVPLVGLPANLLAAPIMAALVPLGFLAGLLGPAAILVNWLNAWLADLLLLLANGFGRVPHLPWGSLSAAGFAAYGLCLLAAALWLVGRLRAQPLALILLLCVGGTTLAGKLNQPREIVFLDIGQGDSTLLRLDGLNVLIDGGGTPRGEYDVGANTVVPALRALGVRSLNAVIATHADADHLEGLSSVLRLMPVGELWIGHRKHGDPVLDAVLAAAQERGVPVREVRRGDQVRAGAATLTVLWPTGAPWSSADNDNSVAVRLDAAHFHTAVLGDLPDPAEAQLGLGRLDLLKVAHHGSHYSTGEAFLNEVHPHDAVISVGRNTYGHPNSAVLERLAARGVRVWRTDQSGTIRWPIP